MVRDKIRKWQALDRYMVTLYFGEFRLVLVQHIKDIQAGEPAYQSIEWFLLRYLKRIEKTVEPPVSPGKVENSVRGMIRFYVDMIDEHSELGERCRLINEEYRKALRARQEKREEGE